MPPTSKAGPVLRAGFTEVLVTGMLTRWIRVSARPMASGAKPEGDRGAHACSFQEPCVCKAYASIRAPRGAAKTL